jgi:hypothetical protein
LRFENGVYGLIAINSNIRMFEMMWRRRMWRRERSMKEHP